MNVFTSSLLIWSEIFFSLRRARITSSRFCVLPGDFMTSIASRTLSCDPGWRLRAVLENDRLAE